MTIKKNLDWSISGSSIHNPMSDFNQTQMGLGIKHQKYKLFESRINSVTLDRNHDLDMNYNSLPDLD